MSLLCYFLQYKLIVCYSSYFSLFISSFFTLQRTERWKITRINHLPIKRLQVIPKKTSIVKRKIQSPQYLSKLVNKKTILNLNIASYFLNILAPPRCIDMVHHRYSSTFTCWIFCILVILGWSIKKARLTVELHTASKPFR